MNTTERFERAVTKLYKAFHENKLNAFKCSACAIGSMCGHGYWSGYSSTDIRDGSFNRQSLNLRNYPENIGYSKNELREIEYLFLNEWNKEKSKDDQDKEIQFKGLCAVVEYLCELNNIPNVMDYTSLFETEDNKPVNELQFA